MNRYMVTQEQRGYQLYEIRSNWPDTQLVPEPLKVNKLELFEGLEQAITSFREGIL